MTVRERIRYTRTIYQLTQQDVADGFGISKQYITQIETGKKIATDERLEEVLSMVYKLGEAKKKGRLKDVLRDIQQQNKMNLE